MKFEFELDKMPTTQQQKGIKKVKGKLQFYDRRGTNNYSLKAQLMKNKPKECQIVWLEAKKVNDEKNRIEIEITEV